MNQVAIPVPLIEPKVSGVGVVIKKDGTVSKPEQPKEKQDAEQVCKADS